MASWIVIGLIILLGAAVTVAISSRLGIPLEVMLLLQSLALSFIPILPHYQLDPDLVFFIFLPPILFYAAYFTSWRDFKANRRPISMLAVGLVLFTTVTVAAVLKALIPAISWPVGFILGAMVSPPDASAATTITRKLGVPRRLVTILEGESLINDATALVAYRFAVAAALTGAFSWHVAALRFVGVGVGGVIVGVVVGFLALEMIRRLNEVRAQTVVSFVTAFGAYLLGEAFHVSGVIATVTAGLYFGRRLPGTVSAQTRVGAQTAWEFVIFVMNAFVFTLIGLQLPTVIGNLTDYTWGQKLFYGAAISVTVIAVRFIWVFPATYLPRKLIPSIARKDPAPPWQPVAVMGWTGMRGIVTLAAAMALPMNLQYRSLLIFLAYSVILVTLILPSITLPWLLRVLGIKPDGENLQDEVRARIAAIEAALVGLNTADSSLYPTVNFEQTRIRYQRRLETLKSNLSPQAFSPISLEDQQHRRLLRDMIRWERAALDRLRHAGEIHDEIFHSIERELDLEELRLRTQRI